MNYCHECGRALGVFDDDVCTGCNATLLEFSDALSENASLRAKLSAAERERDEARADLSHEKRWHEETRSQAAAMREARSINDAASTLLEMMDVYRWLLKRKATAFEQSDPQLEKYQAAFWEMHECLWTLLSGRVARRLKLRGVAPEEEKA